MVNGLCSIIQGTYVHTLPVMTIVGLIQSICGAFSGTVVNGILVRNSKGDSVLSTGEYYINNIVLI